jgi:PAS domain S-box-containing protein
LLNTVLVIEDRCGIELFRFLQQCPGLFLVGLADLSGDSTWLGAEEQKRYFITSDLARITALPGLQVVVNAAADPRVSESLKLNLKKEVELVDLQASRFLSAVLRARDQLTATRLLKGELWAILHSVQDAVEVVDAAGVIKYVNPAFTRVTGIPESKRVNRNIFEVSPHGALAQSLIRQKPVTGFRTIVGGSEAEVISNASPIIVDGEITGAVVVFQPVGDILKLMDQLKHSKTIIENLYAQIDRIAGSRWNLEDLTGQSKVFKAAVEAARRAARSDGPVLISGESGTGKSVFAQAIHHGSARKERLLITFDCSAIPDSIQELELFGCEKGALPGVWRTRLGKIELAHKGTLLVKEIGSLSPFLQRKLLQCMQDKQFYRIGAETPVSNDARVIISANENFNPEGGKGPIMAELYRYPGLIEINLPPLRKRPEDIPPLLAEMMERLNRKLGKQVREVSPRAIQDMLEYRWPGNIDELNSVLERAVTATDGPVIEYRHLAPYIEKDGEKNRLNLDDVLPLDKMEQIMLKLALARYGETLEGKKKAAQALNISLATLYNKLKKYNGL